MATSDEVRRALAVVAAAYPHTAITEHTVELWCRLLADVPIEAVTAACLDYVSKPNQFFPAVGVVRTRALESMETKSERLSPGEAWAEVVAAYRRVGAYGVPEWTNPEIPAAVEACGGWRGLCLSENQTADRARFLQAYERCQKRSRDVRQELPEARKLLQRLAADAERKAIK